VTRYVSDPSKGRDFPHSLRPALGPTHLLYSDYRVFLTGIKQPGRGVDHPHLLATKLKKEYSYTSVPLVGLHGLFWGNLYFTSTVISQKDFNVYFRIILITDLGIKSSSTGVLISP
jgi:hypothetical protein